MITFVIRNNHNIVSILSCFCLIECYLKVLNQATLNILSYLYFILVVLLEHRAGVQGIKDFSMLIDEVCVVIELPRYYSDNRTYIDIFILMVLEEASLHLSQFFLTNFVKYILNFLVAHFFAVIKTEKQHNIEVVLVWDMQVIG